MGQTETKKKGIISAEQWDSGVAPSSSSEKRVAVLAELEKVGRGGMSIAGLEEATGMKWLYGLITNDLFKKEGILERKKVGRGFFYRLVQDEE